jgi:hypothetical protein
MWAAANTSARIRCILYSDDAGTARLSYVYPRIDLVDGTEPTIADLMSGNYYDPNYVNDISNIGKNGTVVSTKFSEVGPTDGLLGYWPLNGDMLEYSGNELHGETGTGGGVSSERTEATVVGGLAPRDKFCYSFDDVGDAIDFIGINLSRTGPYIRLNDGETWSVSFWGFHTTAQGWGTDGICGNWLSYGFNSVSGAIPGGRIAFGSSTTFQTYTTTTSSAATFYWGNHPTLSSLPLDRWFPFVITHNASNSFEWYIDGINITPLAGDIIAGDIYVNRIGRNPDDSGWVSFDGNMMDFRIYDHVLTLPDIDILSKTFDTDSTPRTEMKSGGNGLYTFGEFQEDL